MVEYDPEVLKRHADRLYTQAYLLVVIWALMGFIVGAVIHAILPSVIRSHNDQSDLAVGIWIAASIVGLLIGWARCQDLRIKAQTILCQVEIESNTRAFAQPMAEKRRIA